MKQKRKRKNRKERNCVALGRKNPPSQTEGGAPSSTWSFCVITERKENEPGLLIAEGVNRVELGSTRSRIESGGEADKNGDD